MAGSALVVEFVFQSLGLVPATRHAQVAPTTITVNYTTILDILFLVLAFALVYRFMRTGGPKMLRMMDTSSDYMPRLMQAHGMHH